jgi:hypothetical protein
LSHSCPLHSGLLPYATKSPGELIELDFGRLCPLGRGGCLFLKADDLTLNISQGWGRIGRGHWQDQGC